MWVEVPKVEAPLRPEGAPSAVEYKDCRDIAFMDDSKIPEIFFFKRQRHDIFDRLAEEYSHYKKIDLSGLPVKRQQASVPCAMCFQLRGGLLLMVWLFPIIGLWIFPPVLVSTFKWVKAGFSKN
jgi:hypothetical protein